MKKGILVQKTIHWTDNYHRTIQTNPPTMDCT